MSTLNIIMTFVFIVGVISFFVSFISLIVEKKRKKEAHREFMRKHISDNTVRTMLRFNQKSESSYSLRKSS